MGSKQITANNRVINIATLNYLGVAASPYQFYDQDQDKKILNQIFHDQYFRFYKYEASSKNWKDLKFNFTSIDKEWHNRYSPLYNKEVGIKINKYMMNQQQFFIEWKNNSELPESRGLLLKLLKNNQNKIFKSIHFSENFLKLYYQKIQILKKGRQTYIFQIFVDDYQKMFGPKSLQEIQTIDKLLYEVLLFDFIVYKSILLYVCSDNQNQKKLIESHISKHFQKQSKFAIKSFKYKKFTSSIFQKDFLDEQKKINAVFKLIDKLQLDIIYFQQANLQLAKKLQTRKNIRIVQPYPIQTQTFSVIVIKQDKFNNLGSLSIKNRKLFRNTKNIQQSNSQKQYFLTHQSLKKYNINKSTIIQVIDDLFLISTHLKSSNDLKQNRQQIDSLSNLIEQIIQKFPNSYIIIGGDINSDLRKNQCIKKLIDSNKIQTYPALNQDQLITTKKVRTLMQAQPKKGQLLDDFLKKDIKKQDYVKDFLISNNKLRAQNNIYCLSRGKLKEINNFNQAPLVPNSDYPFDHFMLVSSFDYETQEKSEQMLLKQKYDYEPQKLTKQELRKISEFLVQKNLK